MTEEIIIDGIDVSECCFYNNGKCDNPNGMACNCINNAVCYFKELKHLQKENNILKQTIKNKNFVAIVEENKELKKLKCKFKEYCTCDIEKYRSALEEIRNEIGDLKNINRLINLQKILDIINEALNDN